MARLGAGVRKRADGTLEKRFTMNGKRYSVYGKTSKELQNKEQEIRKQVEAGVYTDNRNITLDKYFNEWLQGKKLSVKSNTIKLYKCYYNKYISPVLGNRRVQKIERRELLNLQRILMENLSPSTCNHVIKVLKIILNDAVKDEVIVKNPADGIKALKIENEKASETIHRALTEEEQKAFMSEVSSDYYGDYIALLLCSGMRCGEASALTWSDIDYKNNVIHINKTLTSTENGVLIVGDSPKSEAGKRDIPITENIKAVLARHRSKQGNVLPMGNKQVFTAVFGGLVHNHAVNRAITSALARLEEKGTHIDHFTAHALRDTFATRFIEQGGQPQTLKTILGHGSLAMTMDLYAHVLPNTKQEEMNNIRIEM